jgi:uncharacterized membrane protein (UPF0127 family)
MNSQKHDNQKYVEINGVKIFVEIADEPGEQIQGLSDRENLCADCGLLFIFPEKKVRNFWMKNMHFPIDIIWISDNKILNISHNLPPEGEHPANTYSSAEPVDYVLEVNAGWTEKRGVGVGDKVLISNFEF